jgi:hypothetical protein
MEGAHPSCLQPIVRKVELVALRRLAPRGHRRAVGRFGAPEGGSGARVGLSLPSALRGRACRSATSATCKKVRRSYGREIGPPHPGPLPQERMPRTSARLAPLNRDRSAALPRGSILVSRNEPSRISALRFMGRRPMTTFCLSHFIPRSGAQRTRRPISDKKSRLPRPLSWGRGPG